MLIAWVFDFTNRIKYVKNTYYAFKQAKAARD